MSHRLTLARVLFWLALAFTGPALAAPLEVYGRLPQIEAAVLSPDGQLAALVQTDGENRSIVIRRIGVAQPLVVISAGDKKLRGLDWAGNGHLLITASTTSTVQDVFGARGEHYLTLDYNLATNTQRNIFRDIDDAMNVIYGGPFVRIIDGKPIVFMIGQRFVDGRGRFSLFRINPAGGGTEVVETGGRDTIDWIVGPQGGAMAQLTETDRTGAWAIRVRNGMGWRDVAGAPNYGATPSLVGIGRDGQSLLVGGLEAEGWRLREVSLAEDRWSEPLADGDPYEFYFHPRTFALSGLRFLEGDTLRDLFFDAGDQRYWNAVSGAYRGDRVHLESVSDDRKRAIVLVDSREEGPAYALIDFDTHKATWIGAAYRGLAAEDISPVRYITYRAADGLEIGAYLTVPRGRDPRALPLIVFPHGGPQSRDSGDFDWWAQAMASRGYAVLQPNFRGSSGYGHAFIRAGYGQWGRKMQSYLSDGVKTLSDQGLIDPARVCIVGASYGGYAALAAATLSHGVYRCAVSVAGVSDLRGLLAYDRDRGGQSAFRYWTRFMGVEGLDDPNLIAFSPLAQAARADIPILLVHGRDDTVVPYSQSADMAEALRRAGKPAQLVTLVGEDHWLSRGDTRLQMLTAVVAFLEANNPPR